MNEEMTFPEHLKKNAEIGYWLIIKRGWMFIERSCISTLQV
jgi:hypothetical protein